MNNDFYIQVKEHLTNQDVKLYFLQFDMRNENTEKVPILNGMKLSIQGKTMDDLMEIFDKTKEYLFSSNLSFKFGTRKLIESDDKEQKTKLLTVYMNSNTDFNEVAETIYNLLIDYKGWYDIKDKKSYQHYAGAVWYRNDRDSDGNYIPV